MSGIFLLYKEVLYKNKKEEGFIPDMPDMADCFYSFLALPGRCKHYGDKPTRARGVDDADVFNSAKPQHQTRREINRARIPGCQIL